MTPARAAHVCATPGIPRQTTATTFTIEPEILASRHLCAADCIMYQVPLRLVSITAAQPFGEKSMAAWGNWPPALLITISTRPKRSHAASYIDATAAGSRIERG